MEIVGIKAEKGKRQFLEVGKVYEVTEEVGKIILDCKRAELKGAKKTSKKAK